MIWYDIAYRINLIDNDFRPPWLYNGSAITYIVAHTIVCITNSASSVQMALYYLYIVSTNGPASFLRTARFVYL